MSRIQFDVLVPHAQSKQVGEVFEEALKRLVTAQRIDSAEVDINDTPRLPEGMDEPLRQTYRDGHHGHSLEDGGVYRHLDQPGGVRGALYELGRGLGGSRTARAVLHKDWVLLEEVKAEELAAVGLRALGV